ncbi:uncharacterized protein LOC593990 isoform X2 [Strongylocentrotus purpuratus]|uniref:Uncharacterized protein n=1 Tax=Strongylocentrotus purpuratus TaxID=7668 RepID=A0A7M7SX42_STRPU|nr:uncharacterized protein LOC593990 isoform X2 [Strongylocentrotus purpuratus]
MEIGLAASFWVIRISFYLFLFTYACLFGLSNGCVYIPTVISGMKWFPRRRGLVAGTLLGFCGIGSVASNFIQTLFINPNNLAPNEVRTVGGREEIYFTQDSVLNRTPGAFLLQAGLCAILQITGLLLSCEPPDYNLDKEMQTLLDKKEKTTSSVGEDTGDSIKKESSPDMEMKSLVTKRKDHRTRNTPPLPSDEILLETDGHNGRPTRTLQEGVVAGEGRETTSKNGDPLWSGLSLDVGQVIRRPYIWLFMAMQASCVLTGVAFLGSYKAFGIGFIRDDVVLATIGSTGSIFNFLGHFLTGVIIDHVSIKVTSIILCGVTSASLFLAPATSLGGGVAPFLIVVCVVLFALGGAYSVQPVLAIRAYGEEHFAGNFILTTMLGFFLPNILAILVTILQKFLSWTTIFIFYGLVPGLAMFAGMFMNLKNQLGQDI